MSSHNSCSFKRALLIIIFLQFFIFTSFSQWTLQVSGTQYPLHSVYFLNESIGFVASNSNNIQQLIGGEIIRTTNGGISWNRVLFDSLLRAKNFYFLDENTGFIVGGSYLSQGFMYKTTNSGVNWVNVTPDNNSLFCNLTFIDNVTGYMGAIFGVYKTTDSGYNWSRILNIQPGHYVPTAKVYFLDINTGFYVRDTGMVYKTTDAGLNWTSRYLSTSFQYSKDIKFININTGFIVCDSGKIFKTSDQGFSWLPNASPVAQNLYSIFFPNGFTGYITAEHTVLKTTNSGNYWFTVFGFPADTLFSSYFLNANTGYVCGDEGRVYKTTTGGIVGIKQISSQIPKEFSLFQNYPNPFNPSTNIKFAVAKATNVKISVYDALGRETETLVNEFIAPGLYEVQWDAVRFSSGIYFYKILTNEYASVKKMSLIK